MTFPFESSNMHAQSSLLHRARNMRRAIVGVVTMLVTLSADSGAQTITQGPNGQSMYNFGVPRAATFGQTFVASGATLTGFSFWLGNENNENTSSASALQLRAYVMTWNGSRAGARMYRSDVRVGPTADLQQYLFATPNISLTPGSRYVAFLSTSGLFRDIGPRPAQAAVWLSNHTSSGGAFVFTDNGDDVDLLSSQNWDDTGTSGFQAQFQATFGGTVVPEPASLMLMAMGLLAVGGWRVTRGRRAEDGRVTI